MDHYGNATKVVVRLLARGLGDIEIAAPSAPPLSPTPSPTPKRRRDNPFARDNEDIQKGDG